MLFVLGLLTTQEVWEVLVCMFILTAAIVSIVYNVSPGYAEIITKASCMLALWKALPPRPGG